MKAEPSTPQNLNSLRSVDGVRINKVEGKRGFRGDSRQDRGDEKRGKSGGGVGKGGGGGQIFGVLIQEMVA